MSFYYGNVIHDENDSVCNNQYGGPDKRRRTKTKITGYLAIKISVDWEFMNSMGRFFECCTLLAIGNLHGGSVRDHLYT